MDLAKGRVRLIHHAEGRTTRRLAILGVALILIAFGVSLRLHSRDRPQAVKALGSNGAAIPANGVDPGVDQAALQACMTEMAQGSPVWCEDRVPGLRACIAGRRICNQAAWQEQQANFPPLQADTRLSPMTQSQAVAAALKRAPAGTSTAAAKVRAMTLGEFESRDGHEVNPHVAKTRQVWVVTVYAPTPLMSYPGGPDAGKTASSYTTVYDEPTGTELLYCTGCWAVQ